MTKNGVGFVVSLHFDFVVELVKITQLSFARAVPWMSHGSLSVRAVLRHWILSLNLSLNFVVEIIGTPGALALRLAADCASPAF